MTSHPVRQVTAGISRGLDDTIEALRWCKNHLHERRASEALRLAGSNLSYLSLALDWQMEGEVDKAESALDHVWWQPHRDYFEVTDELPMDMTH